MSGTLTISSNGFGGVYYSNATSNVFGIATTQGQEKQMYSGNKPLVICGGTITEVKDLDEAQRVAEEQAHAKSANAYILKPVKMVAPKRDVVTTDLP